MFARDPFALDRKLSNAARAWRRFRRELRTSDAPDHVFETASAVADRELLEELEEDVSPLSVPMRRWVYRLLEQRSHREAIISVASAYRREAEPVLAPLQAELTPRDLLLHALSDGARRGAFLTALAQKSAKLRDRRFELAERRFELRERLARRLGPLAIEPNPKLATFARDLLARTEGALEALSVRDLASALAVLLATGARATYPSHLSLRSLVDLLDASRWFDSIPLDLDELPARLARASFARGLSRLGAAFRRGAESTASSPFVMAADAFSLPEHTLAALFERLPLSEEFARRRLEVARAAFPDYQRAWAAAAVLEVRIAAARLLTLPSSFLGSTSFTESFQEELGRALGFELDPRLSGVIFAPRFDEPQRFAAHLSAARLDRELVVRHDEDWFRNPRAREELREQARSPATLELDDDALEAGVLELERSLTSALAR